MVEQFALALDLELSILFVTETVCIVDCDLQLDRKSTRLNSSHVVISYAVFCLKKKKKKKRNRKKMLGHY